jgi:signal transduction histidine kinase/ligand-binding sensor domain-containing protein/DNA-binding response OmpR family regulator
MFVCMKSCIITGFILVLFAGICLGNEFRYLRTEDGLPDGEINSIVQDGTGNMWFATWSGLIRYDGYQFKVFRPDVGSQTGLPEKKIKKLYVDSQNNLWIATSMHLSRFIRENNTFITYSFNEAGSRGVNIFNISELDNHLVVHAVEGIFLLPFSEKDNNDYILVKQPVIYAGEELYYFFNYSSSAGSKLILVNNSNSKSTIFFVSMAKVMDQPALVVDTLVELNEIVNDISYQVSENTLYIATPNGLFPYSMKRNRFVRSNFFAGTDIRKVYCASNNRIYGTVRYPKLLFLDLHTGMTGKFEANPNKSGTLLDNEIHSLFEDFSGNLWIGHQGQGISILNLYRKKFYSFRRDLSQPVSLNSNTVMCFEGTENEIIIGCRNNGLNIIQKKQAAGAGITFESIPFTSGAAGISGDGIWDIAKQSDSLFWLGTEQGLYRLQKTKAGWKIAPFKGDPDLKYSIRKIYIDLNNNLWVGSHGFGLFFIPNLAHNKEGVSYQFTSESENSTSLSDDVILDIFLDSKKRFWVGTNNGLNRLIGDYENLDLSGKVKPEVHFKAYVATRPQLEFLNNNEINCLIENFDGNIWIATQGGGINILNPVTEKFTYITTEQGLPSDDVISMIADEDGYLWIGTNKGLARYNRFESNPTVSVFNSSDGIPGEIFMINAYYKAVDGQMFFGGDKGFTNFYPREIKMNETRPKISFTDLRIRNKKIEIGDTLRGKSLMTMVLDEMKTLQLPYKNNVFSIGVSALHFQHPSDNSIIYTLEGLNRNWITVPASTGYIYLSNIPPGKYLLKAKAISSDGILSDVEKQLNIEITPPWYKTHMSFGVYALLALLLSYLLMNVLINKQKLAYQKKLDRVTIENNESKMLFLTNIAHELRTPLSLIIAPVEDLMRNASADNQWKSHLQLISRNSGYLLRLINQIIDFRKLHAGKLMFQPQKVDVVKVVKEVVLNFQGYDANRHIQLGTDISEESIIGYIDVQKFEEILYNLISNAFKNTYDNHTITVKLRLFKENSPADSTSVSNVHLTVFNEGKEIDEENRNRIFERFYKVDESSEGAGIGLSFAKSLVEMHNGTIGVESIPGEGVAFHVVIPAGHAEVAVDRNNIQSRIIPQPESRKMNGSSGVKENGQLKILIVEDNQELGEFLVNIFSRKYECFYARTGDEAWKLVQMNSPSVVISDVVLPVMDGLELCRKIKENKETCHIPVLLLTANNSQEQITEGYSVGADSYVTKPFDIELLLSQTARLIQNRELIREKYKTQNFMVEVQNSLSTRDEEFLQNVRKILEKNISDPELNVNNLSHHMNLSTTQLYRRVKELTGYSPVEFIRIVKLQKAYSLLNTKNQTVKEVCYLTGFNNMSYFIKCFREQFGITPAYFRDKGQHEKSDEKADVVQV